jgi:hypothetical protein
VNRPKQLWATQSSGLEDTIAQDPRNRLFQRAWNRYTGIVVAVGVLGVGLAACGGSSSTAQTPSRGQTTSSTRHPQSVRFLPGGIRTVVHARLSTRERFTLSTERYRFQGRTYSDLAAGFPDGASSSFHPRETPTALVIGALIDCSRKPLTLLLYGVLRNTADTAELRSVGGSVPLTRVPAPGGWPGGGVIVYGSLAAPRRCLSSHRNTRPCRRSRSRPLLTVPARPPLRS